MNKWMFAVVFAGVSLVGCGGEKDSGSGPPASTDKIGVKACDEYIGKMEACFPKMDPHERSATEESVKNTRKAWKDAATRGGAGADSLKSGCEAALAQLMPICK